MHNRPFLDSPHHSIVVSSSPYSFLMTSYPSFCVHSLSWNCLHSISNAIIHSHSTTCDDVSISFVLSQSLIHCCCLDYDWNPGRSFQPFPMVHFVHHWGPMHFQIHPIRCVVWWQAENNSNTQCTECPECPECRQYRVQHIGPLASASALCPYCIWLCRCLMLALQRGMGGIVSNRAITVLVISETMNSSTAIFGSGRWRCSERGVVVAGNGDILNVTDIDIAVVM